MASCRSRAYGRGETVISRMFRTAARQQRSDREGRDVNLLADDAKRICCRGDAASTAHFRIEQALSLFRRYRATLPSKTAFMGHTSVIFPSASPSSHTSATPSVLYSHTSLHKPNLNSLVPVVPPAASSPIELAAFSANWIWTRFCTKGSTRLPCLTCLTRFSRLTA